jgi:hypothetical protein
LFVTPFQPDAMFFSVAVIATWMSLSRETANGLPL